MQIDFHHATTYVIARFSGFDHEEANIVAYSAQYVDDATNSGIVKFDNKALYSRISSAHKMLDYRNLKELANHSVWVPFHFLPGNSNKTHDQQVSGSFVDKIVCRPNSHVAQEVVRTCIEKNGAPYGLHRLGITMHVYADTWAHQGFVGINDEINEIVALDENEVPDQGMIDKVKHFFGDIYDSVASKFIGGVLPLGHGAVLTFPDRPYQKWWYKTADGTKIERDNPRDFLEAADEMVKAMKRFQLGDPDVDVEGLSDSQRSILDEKFRSITGEDGEVRHTEWVEAIAAGEFEFEGVALDYIPKGEGSWKHVALGTILANDEEEVSDTFPWKDEFLTSDWKMFHDALQAHRFDVLHDVLPKFGICAA
jgi:hypothetical protein